MKQKTIIRAMLGWISGILIGMYGGIVVIFFMQMNSWLKFFTLLGLVSASLGTLYSLFETYKQYKLIMAMELLTKDEKEVNKQNENEIKDEY